MVTPSYEEQRLKNILVPNGKPFATQILEASGFDRFAPQFSRNLCDIQTIKSFDDSQRLVKRAGIELWQAAVNRVQGQEIKGSLPQSDDRMLYWARLQMTLILRQWKPSFTLTQAQREELQWTLERASRGQYSMQFPSDSHVKRIIISGFDPFTLGTPGADHPSTKVRIGNPSGAIALALNGKTFKLSDGSTAVIQTYLLPVNYSDFQKGMQEYTVAPFFKGKGHVLASITMSQGGKGAFWIENWHSRYHATNFADNTGLVIPATLPSVEEASIYPPTDILGYNPRPWVQDKPKQFTVTSLPINAILAAHTGKSIINPETHKQGGYDVIWHTPYSVFPDCQKMATQDFNSEVPPPKIPVAPLANACAQKGSGGNYLSNESGYRNTLLRDLYNPSILAGHLHVPVMTNFKPGDDDQISDALFEAYRDSIVQQATEIVGVIVKTL
ncbi:hypothetical protein HYN46_03075 [Aquirhabdus parva]|uniref:Pyroglutamyl peptidase n=2 Tax=Aquirhabdus parva TaxID=2283318 RepID=A0A345PB36_9GAMM|nr:hypothetical protein HYN46_03075 [Aquirhabdus parva]